MFIAKRGPARKYDTDKWLDNKCRIINKGVDYTCSTASMIIHLRRAAKQMGKRVSIRQQSQPEGLELQSWQTGT